MVLKKPDVSYMIARLPNTAPISALDTKQLGVQKMVRLRGSKMCGLPKQEKGKKTNYYLQFPTCFFCSMITAHLLTSCSTCRWTPLTNSYRRTSFGKQQLNFYSMNIDASSKQKRQKPKMNVVLPCNWRGTGAVAWRTPAVAPRPGPGPGRWRRVR